jgi:hypothetical protein
MQKNDIFQLLDVVERAIEDGRKADAIALVDVIRSMLGSSNGREMQRRSTDVVAPNSYHNIEKWAAIQMYLESVGHPVTFRELIPAMRAGGMIMPPTDSQAWRILGIVVTQNSGNDGKRDWPARFYREDALPGRSSMEDKVGLLRWKQQEAKIA